MSPAPIPLTKSLLETRHPYKRSPERGDSAPLHPGEVLREDFLPHWHLTGTQLAERTGIAPQAIQDLLGERVAMTPEIAARLNKVFAVPLRYWLALQMQYDLWHAFAETWEA
jgi:addiction module HigA family antidote